MARDGALAEYVTAPAASVIALPPEVPFDIGAVVTDAVATPFHALRARGALRAGETVGVVGCGGLGTHAIILARMMGASCIVACPAVSIWCSNASEPPRPCNWPFAASARVDERS